MIEAILWGLVQGLTEFLPVSSSGHLVLVPAFLSELGWDVSKPELAVSAVLHLGTLIAVLVYYRYDLGRLLRSAKDPDARRVLGLLALGTIPALIGLPLKNTLDELEERPTLVAGALIVTGIVLLAGSRVRPKSSTLETRRPLDALIVGVAQAMALMPGISRSGMTITAGVMRDLDRAEAARFSFLLAVPTIAGGGLLSLLDLSATDVEFGSILVGLLVSAVSGYLAIAWLLRVLARTGFLPFAVYCLVVGAIGLVVL